MLGVRNYDQTYVDACRAKIAADVSAFRAVAKSAPESFAPVFFNNLTIVLDALFMHRLRTVEGKDGNPLNEVRVIGNSLMLHGGVLTPEAGIRFDPQKSVLHAPAGTKIELNEAAFNSIAAAFFAEIERKFVAG